MGMGIRARAIRDKEIVGIMIRGITTVEIMIAGTTTGVMAMDLGMGVPEILGVPEVLGAKVEGTAKERLENVVATVVQAAELLVVLLASCGQEHVHCLMALCLWEQRSLDIGCFDDFSFLNH